jgi:hypothetical protein
MTVLRLSNGHFQKENASSRTSVCAEIRWIFPFFIASSVIPTCGKAGAPFSCQSQFPLQRSLHKLGRQMQARSCAHAALPANQKRRRSGQMQTSFEEFLPQVSARAIPVIPRLAQCG